MLKSLFHRRASTVALLTGALLLAACDSVEERIAGHMERAEQLSVDGEPEKAIVELRNVLQLKADHVEARLKIARLLEDGGNFQAAVGHYLVAVENDVTNVDARVRLAQYMLVTNQLDRALELSDQAYELRPRDPDVLAVRASTAFQMDEKDFAIELASRAVEIEPTHAAANVVLITHQVEAGDLDTALAMADTILEVHGEDLSLHLMKLRLLELMQRPEAALEQLELIVRDFPKIATARSALATQYIERGQLDEAEAQLREILALRPGDVDSQLEVIRFLLANRGFDAAETEVMSAIDAAEDPWPFQETLSALYEQNDRDDDAIAVMQAIVDAGEGNVIGAKVRLAQFAIRREERDRAETLVDDVLTTDPENVDALAIRGALQLERNEYDAAIETLRVGLSAEPEDVRLLLLSGRAHMLNGNDALGSDQLATATRVSNYRPDVALEYTRYLLQRGRLDGAEAVLSEAARRAPNDRELLTALADLRLRQEDWVGAEAVAAQLRELDDGAVLAERVIAASMSGQEKFAESAQILQGLANDGTVGMDGTMTAMVQNLVAAQRTEEASALVDDVLRDDPENYRARLLAASLAQSREGTAKAIEMFEAILEDFPQNPEIYFVMYRVRLSQNDREGALQLVRDGVVETDGNVRLRLLLAGLEEAAGNFDAAIEQYELVFEATPESLIAANNLASSLAEHRADDPEQLARAIRIAKRLRGTNVPEMQDTLGWTLFLGGEREEAVAVLQQAAAGLPNNPLVQYHLGAALAANDQPYRARLALERALALASAGAPFPFVSEAEEILATLPEAEAPSSEPPLSGADNQ
ncbi:MAG: tetratricopeptide repeat protein [Pseudomonadota bacterium]